MFEIESVAARDRSYPAPDQPSAEAQDALESQIALWGKLGTYATSSHTDQIVLSKQAEGGYDVEQ
jgi:hypothetical protein